jgi:hypothetical protein
LFQLAATAPPGQCGWLEKGTSFLKSITGESTNADLSTKDIAAAFKEALHIGTDNVVAQLGQMDGFNADQAIHIPLPEQFDTIRSALANVGMSQPLDDLEIRLNRAAEKATPKAKAIFWDAITAMTFEDVQAIYKGPEDSATQYFKSKMAPALTDEMRPMVAESLSQVGAIQTYDRVMGRYRDLPFVPDIKADLTTHVLERSLDGIFYYVAKEEAAIRKNPVKRTTELLKRVFGAK